MSWILWLLYGYWQAHAMMTTWGTEIKVHINSKILFWIVANLKRATFVWTLNNNEQNRKLEEKAEYNRQCTDVVQNTSNWVILRRCFTENGKEMAKNEKLTRGACRTCKIHCCAHIICRFVPSAWPSPSSCEPPIGESCWSRCLHFSSLAYDLPHRSRGRI